MLMQLATARHGGAQPRISAPRCRTPSTSGSSKTSSARSRGCAPASWCRRRTPGLAVERDRAARRRSGVRRRSCISPRTERSARATALLADLRGGRALPDGRSACISAKASAAATPRPASGWPTYYMQEHYAFDDRHADAGGEPGLRRRVRALPRAQGGADRGRLRLGAGAGLAHGQALGAHAQGDAARQASAVGIPARACLVHHPADRGAGRSRSTSPRSSTGSAGTA